MVTQLVSSYRGSVASALSLTRPIVDDFPPLSSLWDNVPVLRVGGVQGNEWGSLTPAKLEQQLEHWLRNTDTYSISKAFLPYWLAQLRL